MIFFKTIKDIFIYVIFKRDSVSTMASYQPAQKNDTNKKKRSKTLFFVKFEDATIQSCITKKSIYRNSNHLSKVFTFFQRKESIDSKIWNDITLNALKHEINSKNLLGLKMNQKETCGTTVYNQIGPKYDEIIKRSNTNLIEVFKKRMDSKLNENSLEKNEQLTMLDYAMNFTYKIDMTSGDDDRFDKNMKLIKFITRLIEKNQSLSDSFVVNPEHNKSLCYSYWKMYDLSTKSNKN
jgi:hypothetical protein